MQSVPVRHKEVTVRYSLSLAGHPSTFAFVARLACYCASVGRLTFAQSSGLAGEGPAVAGLSPKNVRGPLGARPNRAKVRFRGRTVCIKPRAVAPFRPITCWHRIDGRHTAKVETMSQGAADFVRRFAEFWRAPSPERLDTVLAMNARLFAPLTPTTTGLEAGKRAFADLFELMPDMTAEVHRWGATVDGVLIEFTVRGTAGGAPIAWQSVDRFVLGEDGLATERFTYFDSLPLVLALAQRPRAWPAFARSRIGRMRG